MIYPINDSGELLFDAINTPRLVAMRTWYHNEAKRVNDERLEIRRNRPRFCPRHSRIGRTGRTGSLGALTCLSRFRGTEWAFYDVNADTLAEAAAAISQKDEACRDGVVSQLQV